DTAGRRGPRRLRVADPPAALAQRRAHRRGRPGQHGTGAAAALPPAARRGWELSRALDRRHGETHGDRGPAMADRTHPAGPAPPDHRRGRSRAGRHPTPRGGGVALPTPLSERSPAPDLARGMMLLLIALAHVPYFLHAAPTGAIGLHPVTGNAADRIAQVVTLTVVDGRVHTMFGFLFAYGMGQMHARQTGKGVSPTAVRRLLRRRHLWMIVVGAVHAALLWQGDIIGVYGLIGLIVVPLFLGRTDRTLKVWIGVLLGLAVAFAVLNGLSSALAAAQAESVLVEQQRLSIAEPDYLVSIAERLPVWISTMIGGLVSTALPVAFLMGVLAARYRILDEPGRHLVLLRRLALWGIAAGWATGAVLALQHIGVVDLGAVTALSSLHFFAGIFTGVGYARSEEHTSELQSRENLVCRLLLEKKNKAVVYAL